MSLEWDLPLEQADPEIFDLIEKEKHRQWSGIELIASENFTSTACIECLGSVLTNKYSEGLPNARYYGGNEFIDQIEILAQQRALAAYHADPEVWACNVQPYSGSPANFAVYTALLQPGDRLMGLDLPSGGHLTHGFYTPKKKISASSIFFQSFPYKIDTTTGIINYEELENIARTFMPKMIIAGASAYPRDYDYARFRAICDEVGALLLVDMAHFSGLVSSEILANPFEYADVVTTTTHKTMRSARGAIIFAKKQYIDAINQAVFPSLQGGPHNNNIAAIATQCKQLAEPVFKDYCRSVCANIKALGERLMSHGYTLVSNGTENHLVLWDLRPQGISGAKMQNMCDAVAITLNKNCVAGDKSAMNPGGVRIGAPAFTSRGASVEDFEQIAEFLHEALQLCIEIQEVSGKMLKAFLEALPGNEKVADLRKRVNAFATRLPMPGFNNETMRYKSIE